jgi:23S rRNA pseudouridine1911/1915/1917 synthase
MEQVKILGTWGPVMAVYKPVGWLTIPGRGNKENVPVLSHVLGAQLRGGISLPKGSRSPDLFVVHRLDEFTSGVILFATSSEAHKALSQAFETGDIKKTYWAVISGELRSQTVDAPIFKIPSKKNKSVVSLEKGKPSKTLFRQIHSSGGFAIVEAKPITGRSHQIRVHLAHIGCPIVGDKLYGGVAELQGLSIPFPLLHARELEFVHPESKTKTTVVAEVDGLMREVMGKLNINVTGSACF